MILKAVAQHSISHQVDFRPRDDEVDTEKKTPLLQENACKILNIPMSKRASFLEVSLAESHTSKSYIVGLLCLMQLSKKIYYIQVPR